MYSDLWARATDCNRFRVGKMGGFIFTNVTVLISSICHRFYIRSNYPSSGRRTGKNGRPSEPCLSQRNRFGCVIVDLLWLHLLRRSFQYFRDQFPARWIDNELKWRVMTWSTNSSERPNRNITWRRFSFWVFQRSWCFTSWHASF